MDMKNLLKSAAISAVVVPAMGIVAHVYSKVGSPLGLSDASLAHRFECAYTLNPQHSHYTTYTYYPHSERDMRATEDGRLVTDEGVWNDSWVEPAGGEYDKYCLKEKYMAHPALTASLYAGVMALAYRAARRRETDVVRVAQQQKTK